MSMGSGLVRLDFFSPSLNSRTDKILGFLNNVEFLSIHLRICNKVHSELETVPASLFLLLSVERAAETPLIKCHNDQSLLSSRRTFFFCKWHLHTLNIQYKCTMYTCKLANVSLALQQTKCHANYLSKREFVENYRCINYQNN